MICVARQKLDKQRVLLIDFDKLNIVCYGDIQQVSDYFKSLGIHFDYQDSDLENSGWDLLYDELEIYIIVDISFDIDLKIPLFFYIKNEATDIASLIAYLKKYVRDDKLNKLEL